MSNADQLKYMRMQETLDKKVTPIRRNTHTPPRGHAKRPPEPIIFPQANVTQEVTQDIPHPDTDTQALLPFPRPPISMELRSFIHAEIHKALDEYSANLYHLLDRSEAEIITMGAAQFQAFMRVVWEEDE